MKRILALVLSMSILSGAACSINLTPSQISGLLTAIQTTVATLPNVPASVTDALTIAQQAITADASGKTWPAIARQALTTLYSDLPATEQNNLTLEIVVNGLEAALQTLGA